MHINKNKQKWTKSLWCDYKGKFVEHNSMMEDSASIACSCYITQQFSHLRHLGFQLHMLNFIVPSVSTSWSTSPIFLALTAWIFLPVSIMSKAAGRPTWEWQNEKTAVDLHPAGPHWNTSLFDLNIFTTDHFWEPLGTTSSRQKTQHHLRSTKNCFFTLCCNSVLASDGKLKGN